MTEPLFEAIAVIGLGLIGSSVARGIKARGLARKITGYDLSPYLHARASELTFCDEIAQTPGEAVAGAELVVIAVPVGAKLSLMGDIVAEVIEKIDDEWVRVRLIEVPEGKGAPGDEELCHATDVRTVL